MVRGSSSASHHMTIMDSAAASGCAPAPPNPSNQTERRGEEMAQAGNRAIVIKDMGEWEQVLELVHLPKPQIRPGHVLVRVVLRPVHSSDLLICSPTSTAYALYDLESNLEKIRSKGVINGQEGGVGIIEEIGEGVTFYFPGQRVHLNILFSHFTTELQGSWQDYMLIKQEDAIPVPDNIGDEVAAQFSFNPWTAYGLFKEIDCPKGEYILISGAGSVICRLFIQLAKHEGYKTIGIVRREDLKKELLAFGAEAVINSTLEDVAKAVKKITNGQGAYLAIDSVGGIMTKSVAASVRDGRQVMVIGELGSGDVVISQLDLRIRRKVQISLWYSDPYFVEKDKIEAAIKACWKNFQEGIWKLPPATKFDLSDFKQALHESQKAGRPGKVLLQSS